MSRRPPPPPPDADLSALFGVAAAAVPSEPPSTPIFVRMTGNVDIDVAAIADAYIYRMAEEKRTGRPPQLIVVYP